MFHEQLINDQSTGKGQFLSQFQKRGNTKKCSSYQTIVLISYASNVMLKIPQDRFQHYVNWYVKKED